ncbi:MAG: dihydropteroate synthase [Dehalococcoidia bacterium]|nr:dihydropteroate synthase [Dehalococcoidia bacterium]MDD5495211.1 dihydropteroate synthase [Dehalococcoidia bacterium]
MEKHDIDMMRCGGMEFRWGSRTYIMGIINLSPDSFSGDGLKSADAAMAQAEAFMQEGVDFIDVGGESTRPDSKPVSVEEEIDRIVPFIRRLSKATRIPISVDSYKTKVIRSALDAGACMINDISSLREESGLAGLAAERGVPIILTSNERGRQVEDIMKAVKDNLNRLIEKTIKAGVSRENIIIDPGIGFGKTVQQNLEIMRRLEAFRALGRPILIGTSRKSVIGAVLDLPVEQRLEGTAATVAIGICKGADIVRVHDVRQMKLVCRMSDAIVRGNFKG